MGPWWILSYQGSLPLVSPTLHILAWVSEQELLQCLLNSLPTPLALRLLAQTPLLPLVHIFPWRIKWVKSLINKISPEDRLQLSKWGTELSFQSRDEHQCFCPSYSNTYLWRGSVAKPCSRAPHPRHPPAEPQSGLKPSALPEPRSAHSYCLLGHLCHSDLFPIRACWPLYWSFWPTCGRTTRLQVTVALMAGDGG